jgi:hypothetical protein
VGSADWVHWGRLNATDVDRKAGVTPQISNYVPLGGANATVSTAVISTYTWTDGTPAASASTRTGLRLFNEEKGFEFTAPADTTPRTLKVYVGANGARARFEARLSDGSAPVFNTIVDQPSGRSSRVITLNYQAAAAGQTLTVRYIFDTKYLPDFQSRITLESAALQGGQPPTNQAPVLAAIGPHSVEENQTLTFAVNATDADGPPPLVLTDTNLPSGASFTDFGNGSGQFSWTPTTGAAAGSPYNVTFTATDDGGAGLSDSETVTITVLPAGGGGGSLSGATAVAPASVGLTSVGSADWVHWGRLNATDVDRKAGVTPQISNYVPLGGANASRSTRVASTYTWTDGIPASSATTRTGLWLFRADKGFEFTAPADTTSRTLKVYVGAAAARGRFEASLSDGSAPVYTTTVDQPSGRSSRVITLNYQAAAAGQTLTVRYIFDTVYLPDFQSWITLESAALQ